jgi:hypothetical protein
LDPSFRWERCAVMLAPCPFDMDQKRGRWRAGFVRERMAGAAKRL